MGFKFDEIGYWSEVKLEILREYAAAYSTIMRAQKAKNPRFRHVYIDGFAGSGRHLSKATGELVEGSPVSALAVRPPFDHYYFVDLDGDKVDSLRAQIGDRKDVDTFAGDCNDVLLRDVFPRVKYSDYRRGLCLLDPYGLHLDWTVMEAAGGSNAIDMFLNFPIMDMNRNALWRSPERTTQESQARMTSFWGDESWRDVAYQEARQGSLFGQPDLEKVGNEEIAEAFRQRLMSVGGFANVPQPLPMRNSRGAVVYYLFFASQRPVALKIVTEVFAKYSKRGL